MDQADESVGLEWTAEIDHLLAKWCDHAKCFEWMHTESFSVTDRLSKRFIIIINSLTAIAGASNIIAGGYSVDGFQFAWVFGGISIAVSTLNILQEKLGYQASSQLHKKLASDWSSIRIKIEEVVILPYSGRKDCKTFLRYVKADINRATGDGSSLISKEIRDECYLIFKGVAGFDIPDICGQVEHTRVWEERLL